MKKILVKIFSIFLISLFIIAPITKADDTDINEPIESNEQIEPKTETQESSIVEDGIYEICPSANEKLSISVQNNTYSNTTNIRLENNNHLKRQKFYIYFDQTKKAYVIKALKENKVLDVSGGRKENYSNVQLYEYNGTLAQQWEIKKINDNEYSIFSKNSNKCLDIFAGYIKNGSNIQIFESNNTKAQKFTFKKCEELQCDKIVEEGYYYISSALSKNKVISVNNGDYNNLANVNIWDKNNKEYQKYKLLYDESKKSYTIMAVHSNKVLDVYAAGQGNCSNVEQYESNNTDAQRWIIKQTEDGYYNIISKCNELCLDISGATTKNGTNIQTYQLNGTKAQKFEFTKADINIGEKTIDDGTYNIIPKIDNNKALEIEGKSSANCKKIQMQQKLNVINKSQSFEVKYLENGYYSIKSHKSGKPIEVENGGHANTTKIQQNAENGSNIQQWIIKKAEDDYFYIVARCNGLYIDIPGGRATAGTNIQMYEGNNTNAQKFKFVEANEELISEKTIEEGYYTIATNLNSNKVLDISAGSYNNCANLQIWSKDNVQQQKFKITYNEEDNYYEIQSVNSGKYLDVAGNGKTDGTNVAQYQKNNSNSQKWAIQKADKDSYYIIALNSALFLDVRAGQTTNGTNIQIYEGNESNAQKFIFKPVLIIDEDYYKITIKKDPNKCFDISGGSTDENANLQIWSLDNVNQQVYEIEAIDNTYYKIIARNSNKVLTATSNNNVVQTTYNEEDNQQWSFEIAENGYYKIKSKSTDLYMDVNGNGTANGTNIGLYAANDSIAQMFKFNTLLRRKGIDVSHHNGVINWNLVKQSGQVDYAIIRAGYRGYRTGAIVTDYQFDNNIKGIKNNRIDIGLYFFTQAINVQEAIEEANYVIKLVREYDIKLKYPIYIDSEYTEASSYNPGRADGLDKGTRTDICKAFCDTIRNAGYTPGIYASKNWFYNNLDISKLGSYDIWVAHYTGNVNKQTDYKYRYDMWQYTSSGNVSGVYGPVENGVIRVDMNICYKNY